VPSALAVTEATAGAVLSIVTKSTDRALTLFALSIA